MLTPFMMKTTDDGWFIFAPPTLDVPDRRMLEDVGLDPTTQPKQRISRRIDLSLARLWLGLGDWIAELVKQSDVDLIAHFSSAERADLPTHHPVGVE